MVQKHQTSFDGGIVLPHIFSHHADLGAAGVTRAVLYLLLLRNSFLSLLMAVPEHLQY